MSAILWVTASWFLGYIALGAVWYNFDRKRCHRPYRALYKMTHKDPLPDEAEKGFIFNASIRQRVAAATVASTFVSILSVWIQQEYNPLGEIVLWVVEIPATLIGFYLGPLAYRLWQGKEKVLNAIEKVEKGEVDVGAALKEKVSEVSHKVEDAVTQAGGMMLEQVEDVKSWIFGGDRKDASPVSESDTDSRGKKLEPNLPDPEQVIKEYFEKR